MEIEKSWLESYEELAEDSEKLLKVRKAVEITKYLVEVLNTLIEDLNEHQEDPINAPKET